MSISAIMNDDIMMRLNAFAIKDCQTQIRINEAIIKTLKEITSLNDCGAISDWEFILLGKDLWMK